MIIFIVIAFLIGVTAGATAFWCTLPQTLKHHIDYRQRWEDAVSLLGAQDQLTDEQIALIRDGGKPAPEPAAATSAPAPVSAATLRTLHSMASWDRKDAEIARAKRGLPPIDDLVGMASWDVKDVLDARTKWGTG